MDIERSIEFLVQNQARYEAQNAERFRIIDERFRLLTEAQAESERRIQELSVAQKEFTEGQKINNDVLFEAQRRTEIRLQQLAERVEDLAADQKQTTSNLNALIKVVDDLLRHDGRRPPSSS